MRLISWKKVSTSIVLGLSLASSSYALTPSECLDQIPDNIRNQLPLECRSANTVGLCGKPLEVRESLIETSTTALAGLTVDKVMQSAAKSANVTEPMEAFGDIWASFQNEEIAWFSRQESLWCDRQTNTSGEFIRNGYPVQCSRPEGFHIIPAFMQAWKPIAAVNRFDLAALDGANCGEQRLIFANNTMRRSLIIFEAVIPNPKPALGLDACLPVAQFWAQLTGLTATQRKTQIEQAFVGEHAVLKQHGFSSFMSQQNLTQGTGQVRINSFDTDPWVLRELKLVIKDKVTNGVPSKVLGAITAPVASNVFGALWNDTKSANFSASASCQNAIVDAVPSLLDNNPNTMGAVFPQECLAAESADTQTDNLPTQLIPNGQLWQRIQGKLRAEGSNLTPTDIVKRAHFSTSCIGCHRQASNDLGGGLLTPPIPAFVHVSEQLFEACPDGTQCHAISALLKESFLPHRKQVLDDALCALSTDRVVARTLRSLTSRSTDSSTSTRTIGGKLIGAAH